MAAAAKWSILVLLALCGTTAAMPNVKLDILGDGEGDAIVTGGLLILECEHNTPEVDVETVVWTHHDGAAVSPIATYPAIGASCGEGDYEDRATCVDMSPLLREKKGHSLTLSNVEYPLDNADYMCTVTETGDPDGRDSDIETASVNVPLVYEDTFMTDPLDPTAPSVDILCTTGKAKPVANVQWTHGGAEVGTDVTDCDADDAEYCSVVSTLTLTSHSPGDEVTCTFEQGPPFSSISHPSYKYEFPPSVVQVEITAEETDVMTGDDIALTCTRSTVDDENVTSVTFYKGGNEIATWAHHCTPHDDYGDREVSCAQLDGEYKHTLDIGDAMEDDTGEYKCAVDTIDGTFDSDTVDITVTAGGNGGTPSLLHNLWMIASLGLVWLLRA